MLKDSEDSVIGAMLINQNIIDDVLEIVDDEDFYDLKNRLIFRAINTLRNNLQSVDVITVAESLSKDELNECGGIGHISSLVANTASSVNAKAYAKVVKNASQLRSLSKSLSDCFEIVNGSISYEDALSEVNSKLSFTADVDDKEVVDFDVTLKERIQDLDRRFNSDQKIDGMTTGFRDLDDLFLGVKPGDLWIFGARPSMGKTAFMLNVCSHRIKMGDHVLCFSVEMSKEKLTDRMIIDASSINAKAFRTGELKEEDWPKLTAGVSRLKGVNRMTIIDKPSIDLNHLMSISRKIKRKSKVDFIAIDYLTIITSKGHKSKIEEYSHISKSLKALAREMNCPVMCLAQLNRNVENRNDRRPSSSDLRETGQIEQDADIISFLYRDEVYDPDTANPGIAEVITTKARDGEIGTVYLQSQLQYQRFKDLPSGFKPHEPEPETTYKPYSN